MLVKVRNTASRDHYFFCCETNYPAFKACKAGSFIKDDKYNQHKILKGLRYAVLSSFVFIVY
jgi:hypothetical protein